MGKGGTQGGTQGACLVEAQMHLCVRSNRCQVGMLFGTNWMIKTFRQKNLRCMTGTATYALSRRVQSAECKLTKAPCMQVAWFWWPTA